MNTESRMSYKQYKYNLLVFQLTGIDFTVMIIPVIMIIWSEAKLAFHEMLFLQSLFLLAILIFEIPSGALSDSWSRKKCSFTSMVLMAIGLAIYSVGSSFWTFALAEMTFGIGVAFQTGNSTSIAYESITRFEMEDHDKFYGKIVSQRMVISYLFSAFGAISGGLIGYFLFIRLPIIIASIGFFLFAILVLNYTEPSVKKADNPKSATLQAFTTLKSTKILAIVVFSLISYIFIRIGFWAFQHILITDFAINSLILGVIIGSLNAISAIIAFTIRKNVKKIANVKILLLLTMTDLIFFMTLLNPLSILVIVLFAYLAQISRSTRFPVVQVLIQNKLKSEERATMISIISFIGSIGYFIVSAIIDILGLERSMTITISIIGIITLFSIFVLLWNINRNNY